MRRLLDHGAVDRQNVDLALLAAAQEDHLPVVHLLLAAGADTSWTSPGTDDETALAIAVQEGHTETVRRLLDHGAVDRQNAGEALRAAIETHHHAVAQLLRDHAAGTGTPATEST